MWNDYIIYYIFYFKLENSIFILFHEKPKHQLKIWNFKVTKVNRWKIIRIFDARKGKINFIKNHLN
jgi:hypothetical protein